MLRRVTVCFSALRIREIVTHRFTHRERFLQSLSATWQPPRECKSLIIRLCLDCYGRGRGFDPKGNKHAAFFIVAPFACRAFAAPAAEFLDDAVVRDRLPHKLGRYAHWRECYAAALGMVNADDAGDSRVRIRQACGGSAMVNGVPHVRLQTCEPCRAMRTGQLEEFKHRNNYYSFVYRRR
jgi:hypothetical protein